MSITAIVTLTGVILTFFIGIANFVHSWINAKRINYINQVTAERVAYLKLLREKITEFCTAAYLLPTQDNEKHTHRKDVYYLSTLIKLLLDTSDDFDKKFIDQIIKVRDLAVKSVTPEYINKVNEFNNQKGKDLKPEIDKLLQLTEKLLKHEWEGIKEESTYGQLSTEKKRALYDTHLVGKAKRRS